MDPITIILVILLIALLFGGGEARRRSLYIPWGGILGVLMVVLILRLLGII